MARLPSEVPFLVKGPSYAEGRPGAAEIAQFREAIGHVRALAFFDYWASKGGAGGLPDKAHIDPIEIPKLLPALFIEEWDADAGQSRIRLAGEFHREPDNSSIQGRRVEELAKGATADIWKACDHLNFFELRPTICGYDLEHFEQPFVRHADLALPVRDGEGSVLTYGYSWLL